MRRLVALIAVLIFLVTCYSPPRVESKGDDALTRVSKVGIKSIEFYSDKLFTEPAAPHPYMSTSREELKKLVRACLPKYGMELVNPENGDDKISIEVKLCIIPSLVVGLYFKADIYHDKTYLFEITGDATCAPSYQEIQKNQGELVDKVIAEFAKKLGREKINPPKK